MSVVTTNQAMYKYVYFNIETRYHNHCCHEKAVRITYSDYVPVALVIQHAKRTRILYCHLWLVRLYHTFQHYLINGTILEKICCK